MPRPDDFVGWVGPATTGTGGVVFDPSISLGNILTILGLIGAIFAVGFRLENRMTKLETMVGPMWEAYRRYLSWLGGGGVERRVYPPHDPSQHP